jgi:hypothetical protein
MLLYWFGYAIAMVLIAGGRGRRRRPGHRNRPDCDVETGEPGMDGSAAVIISYAAARSEVHPGQKQPGGQAHELAETHVRKTWQDTRGGCMCE